MDKNSPQIKLASAGENLSAYIGESAAATRYPTDCEMCSFLNLLIDNNPKLSLVFLTQSF